MNRIVLVGKVFHIKKVETSSGIDMVTFSVGVKRYGGGGENYVTDWFNCKVFKGQATAMLKHCADKSDVVVTGSMHIDKSGDKTYHSVMVESVNWFDWKEKKESESWA